MPPTLPSRRAETPPRTLRMNAALVAFGVIVVLAPLAFGAVDRVVQTALVLVLAVGIFLQPPALLPLGRRGNALVLALIGILVLKEFLPWQWFGGARWRGVVAATPGLEVAGTHHPEPARAFDSLLVALLAVVWLQWVATMAARRQFRVALVWILFASGIALAAVCFLAGTKFAASSAIYGLRYTPGWAGWGTFPNRNHTASLLAMSALAGLGCTVWAGVRRRQRLAIFAGAGVFFILVALLVSKSRGGLLALGAGGAVFGAMMLWRHRSRRAIAMVSAAVAILAVVVLLFGNQVLDRFSAGDGKVSTNQLRKDIWANAVTMWRDAPLLGHGVESFTGLFPFYQHLTLDDGVVLHPESSWLQWLCELGLIPVAILTAVLVRFITSRLGPLFKKRGTFYLAAGALAGVVAILAHSAIDVPAHRWSTAGFALALLAIACPISREAQLAGAGAPRAALVPLVIGAYWALPFFGWPLTWQQVHVEQLRAREAAGIPPRPSLDEWKTALHFFPLDAELHHRVALRELESPVPKTSDWQRHIDIVHRLVPCGWHYPISHARAVKRLSPALCIQYWQVAVLHSGWRGTEIMGQALADTAGFAIAESMWTDFVHANPAMALAYARTLPESETRPMFDLWWAGRAHAADISSDEMHDFYRFGRRWAKADQVLDWMKAHASRRREDFRPWVELLHATRMDDRAWALWQSHVPNPPFPASPASAAALSREELEAHIVVAPDNTANVVELARLLEQDGDSEGARRRIFSVAVRKDAPSWFLRRAGYYLADDGKFAEAVAMILRDK